jgi:hypothetical protein
MNDTISSIVQFRNLQHYFYKEDTHVYIQSIPH